jgi:hypothetical protein
MLSKFSPIFSSSTQEAISVQSSDDDDSNNSDFNAPDDEMTANVPTQTFMWPSAYASWTEVTAAVHAQALSVNKQVSIVAKFSNSKRKVYRCSHWIAANKKHVKLVKYISYIYYNFLCCTAHSFTLAKTCSSLL